MKSLSLIFTPQSCATNCRCNWKTVAIAVDLYKGGDSLQQTRLSTRDLLAAALTPPASLRWRYRAEHRQLTQQGQKYGFGLAPQTSGRYWRHAIPI